MKAVIGGGGGGVSNGNDDLTLSGSTEAHGKFAAASDCTVHTGPACLAEVAFGANDVFMPTEKTDRKRTKTGVHHPKLVTLDGHTGTVDASWRHTSYGEYLYHARTQTNAQQTTTEWLTGTQTWSK